MNLCQKPNRIKLIERDESLHMKTHKRTEKRCCPDFFIMCHFHAFMCGARLKQIKRIFFAVKKKFECKRTRKHDFAK